MNFKDGHRGKSRGRLVHIGYGHFIQAGRVVALLAPETAPVQRLRQRAKEEGRLIDATCGRKTLALILTDSNHVILAAAASAGLAEIINVKLESNA